MKTYPKIETLYDRDMKTGKVTDKIRLPEFENIIHWLVTEKIDGTNIRILFYFGELYTGVDFKGRTDRAQVPKFLMGELEKLFPIEKLKDVFDEPLDDEVSNICLYGEGYGPRINKGGIYRNKEDGVSFRLFDVWINGWWLKWEDVLSTAQELEIQTVPSYGIMGLRDAIKIAKGGASIVAKEDKGDEGVYAEGVVARAYPMVLFRNGNPLRWKLKKRDYEENKKWEPKKKLGNYEQM